MKFLSDQVRNNNLLNKGLRRSEVIDFRETITERAT